MKVAINKVNKYNQMVLYTITVCNITNLKITVLANPESTK